jgi:iron complex outermembrane receptor protein
MRVRGALRTYSGAAIAILAVPGLQAHAADAPPSDFHAAPATDIIVTAPYMREREDILSGVSTIQGAALTQALRPTIGETLNRTPGVSSTAFGPNASRPVLRGLQGERVRVLTDGMGSIDVSNTSVDHAVVVNPLLAERIEVLRGPEALLYGSSAIGGVVNVIDKRIPRAVPDEPIHVDAIATYGSAANERSGGGAIDIPVTSRLVVHADGSYLKTGDMRIGGYALTAQKRAEATATSLLPPDPENPIDYLATTRIKGTLPNTASQTWTAGVGAAFITDTGNFGLSYGHYDSLYGVPIRYATLPGETQEGPRLALVQNRLDARAEVDTGGGFLETIRARLAYASYRHRELEDDGAIGTTFRNHGMEGRIELVQAAHGAWKGASGVQFSARDFDVVGEEAFLPKNQTGQIGLFTLQQIDAGAFRAEAGVRYEYTALDALPSADQASFFAGTRRFGTVSASAGASYALSPRWRLGLNLSRTARAPSAEELFSNGPHGGTEAFEIGDPAFRVERSWSAEAVLRGKGPGYTFEASAYHDWFSHFIYENRTGATEDGLPVYQFLQAPARYYGFEAQGTLALAQIGETSLVADALGDYVHARIDSVGPAPRIPPLRLLGGIAAKSDRIDGRIEVEWNARQDRVATFETPTSDFTLVNAELTFRPGGAGSPLSFALSANNIFDVNARRHASVLKDYAPLSGRDIRITARATF